MFQDLPHDVIIRIMLYTGVRGIIALRQVSTSLLRASYQRIVWIEALRAICIQRSIFLSSFPISDMTLPQLEHAATVTPRFVARMRHKFSKISPPSPLRPFSTRILSSFDSPTEPFNHMVFVPGGRFLLTTGDRNVRLWDLGFHSGALLKPFPIASTDVGHSIIYRVAPIQSATNVDETLVLVISRDIDFSGFLNVYRITPSTEEPHFLLLASAPVSDGSGHLKLFSQRHVAVREHENILLWNFIEDSWVRWSDEYSGDDIAKISICNDNLIALIADQDHAEIKLMKLPPFDLRQPDIEPSVKTAHPILSLTAHPDSFGFARNEASFGGFESTAEFPIHFDIRHYDEDDRIIKHYVLETVENGGKNGLPGCLPILVGETTLVTEDDMDVPVELSSHLHWLDETTIQFSWTSEDDGVVYTHVSIFPLEGAPQVFSGGLFTGAGIVNGEFCLCPFSGRLCLRVKASPGNGYEVRIVDYLAPL
ncbi:hypothetical protein C8R44DRAFT_767515 [Mycena epipterygia]|nr:hypothetical protein C8R44DRAFT_767515 [Mycena epipterygia]